MVQTYLSERRKCKVYKVDDEDEERRADGDDDGGADEVANEGADDGEVRGCVEDYGGSSRSGARADR